MKRMILALGLATAFTAAHAEDTVSQKRAVSCYLTAGGSAITVAELRGKGLSDDLIGSIAKKLVAKSGAEQQIGLGITYALQGDDLTRQSLKLFKACIDGE